MRGISYSKSDDRVIVNCIKNSPQNLTNAYENAGNKLGRTSKAIQQHWYHIRDKYTNVFQTSSVSKTLVNGKNTINKSSQIIQVTNGEINLGKFIIKGDFSIKI